MYFFIVVSSFALPAAVRFRCGAVPGYQGPPPDSKDIRKIKIEAVGAMGEKDT
jgi:hypothetical protein